MKRQKIWILGSILLLLAVFVLATRGPRKPSPNPPGTFSFAALGDAPYYPWEDLRYRVVLQDLQAHDLSWVLQVGDIFWRPCTDRLYKRSLGWYNALRHPVIYTPGDNEWFDCWEPGSGGFAPQGRLKRIRQIFFAHPDRSLGGKTLPLTSQGGEFVENARWSHQGMVFATMNIIGSQNGLKPFPARTPEDDAAVQRRTKAAAAWVRETFNAARTSNATAVVIAFHANPAFEDPPDDSFRKSFEPFLTALEEETERFRRPVLVIQGDDHEYTVDHPLKRRTTGRTLENLTRLQVPGSPQVGWVRVVVTPGAANPFSFEERVVPRWKHW